MGGAEVRSSALCSRRHTIRTSSTRRTLLTEHNTSIFDPTLLNNWLLRVALKATEWHFNGGNGICDASMFLGCFFSYYFGSKSLQALSKGGRSIQSLFLMSISKYGYLYKNTLLLVFNNSSSQIIVRNYRYYFAKIPIQYVVTNRYDQSAISGCLHFYTFNNNI